MSLFSVSKRLGATAIRAATASVGGLRRIGVLAGAPRLTASTRLALGGLKTTAQRAAVSTSAALRAGNPSGPVNSVTPSANAKFYPTIDATKITKSLTNSPKPKLPKEELKFGSTTTDHMLVVDWVDGKGWTAPAIVPYGPFAIDPAASVFHYALECFEGMKAYKDDAGAIRLFRPDKNMERINKSVQRLNMPPIDGAGFLDAIKELVRVDQSWIPQAFGYSLYIRPTVISTYAHVGVSPSKAVRAYCILSPVGPYYPTGFKPVKLLADTKYVRAWPGGTGDVKLGSNYALGIKPQVEAAKRGYAQILWVFGPEHQVTEVGTMNQFFFWKNEKTGKPELVTAPLDGTILPGVTRDSILALARGWNEFDVVERPYTMKEVVAAVNSGRMLEAFGAGTAAIVSPVDGISFNGKDYAIPLNPKDPKAQSGPLAARLIDTIMNIQYGKLKHNWSITI